MQHLRSTRPAPTSPVRLGLVGVAIGAITLGVLSGATPALAAEPNSAPATTTIDTADTLLADVPGDARKALVAARAALSEAATATSAATTAGLDIGMPTTVDTSALSDAIDELDAGDLDISPVLFLPTLTTALTKETETVVATTEQVTTKLAEAQAKKAAEEAAAKKAAEEAAAKKAAEEAAAKKAAEEAAAAEAEAAQQSSSSDSSANYSGYVASSGGGSGDNSPAGAQASARAMLGNYGWGDDQFGCLVSLWNRESGWNYQAYNAGSGATGIPQALPGSKMASAGSDWQTNAATQVAWGLGYISSRYGSPCGAWGHSESVGWY